MSAEDQQAIQDAEAALLALGLDTTEYQSALQNLQKRRDALQNIQREQNNQFYPESFNIHGKINALSADSDKVIRLARFLRKYAEHVVTHTLTLQTTYPTVTAIVDHIPNMGSEDA